MRWSAARSQAAFFALGVAFPQFERANAPARLLAPPMMLVNSTAVPASLSLNRIRSRRSPVPGLVDLVGRKGLRSFAGWQGQMPALSPPSNSAGWLAALAAGAGLSAAIAPVAISTIEVRAIALI